MSTSDEAGIDWARDAEAERRAGRPAEAQRLAEAGLVDEPHRLEGRIVLALACLDLGDAEAARRALEVPLARWAVHVPEPLAVDEAPLADAFHVQSDPLADLAEAELEHAFASAESEPGLAWTTDRVAEAALRAVEAGEPEGVALTEPDSPFATETVASLLEQQGDPERARAIRRSLAREHEEAGVAPDEHKRWVGTLERWLENLRRASR